MHDVAEKDTKRVDKIAGANDVHDLASFVRPLTRATKWGEIDFRNVGGRKAERVNPYWAEVLSNALMGELAAAKLRIRLPSEERALKAFARSGLLFAFAQRDRETTCVVSADSVEPDWSSVKDWARNWEPSDRGFERDLTSSALLTPYAVVDREIATFLNPHLQLSDKDLVAEVSDGQAIPWAERLVGRVALGLEKAERDELTSAVGKISTELVLNLGHAFRQQTGLRATVPPKRQKCYVQLYTTDGGGGDSFNRLHIVVADTGHGIVRTLRPKLIVRDRSFRDVPNGEIVRMTLQDELPEFGRASGLGYRRVVETVVTHGGQLRLTTGSYGLDHDVDVVQATVDASSGSPSLAPLIREDRRLWFLGTTAHATIPLQPRART